MSDQDALSLFRSYNWDNSQEWQDYLLNVEIASGREDALTKVKAKWFKRNVDANLNLDDVVKPIPSAPEAAPTPEPKPKPTSSSNSTRSFQQESRSTAAPRPVTAAMDAAALRSFLLHLLLIVLAVVSVIPFSRWGRTAYRYFNLVAIMTQGNKIILRQGWPSVRPLSSLKDWAVRAFPTTDFQYMMMAVMFMPQAPMTMAVVPVAVLAVYHVFAFAAQHLAHRPPFQPWWRRYGAQAHGWLIQNQQHALVTNATAEITVGFMLIAQLLTPSRNFILLYLYWNMLKLRYWSRDASTFHRQAWRSLNERTRRYRDMVPVVDKPIGFVVKWFNSQR